MVDLELIVASFYSTLFIDKWWLIGHSSCTFHFIGDYNTPYMGYRRNYPNQCNGTWENGG